jgi:hypothetical protein
MFLSNKGVIKGHYGWEEVNLLNMQRNCLAEEGYSETPV